MNEGIPSSEGLAVNGTISQLNLVIRNLKGL